MSGFLAIFPLTASLFQTSTQSLIQSTLLTPDYAGIATAVRIALQSETGSLLLNFQLGSVGLRTGPDGGS
jgi:hypothetical protein